MHSHLITLVAVPQHGLGVHEDLQSDLHDATDRTLERLSAVLSANVTGFSIKFLGIHQRITGNASSLTSSKNLRHLTCYVFLAGIILAGAVFMGIIQGHVAYAVHRLWQVSAPNLN